MLSDVDVLQLCQRLGCAPEAPAIIAAIRSSPPARRVSSRAGNVSVRYPSRKMGVIIQAESHRNELAGIYEMEHDPATLAYYDQPPPIKLTYLGRHGRRVGVLHTPDFFVLRTDALGWEEWKLELDLVRLANTMPHRYVRMADGTWRCPPGEQYAAPFGFYYRVRSSAEINWIFQRNFQFLSDYFHPDCPPVADQIVGAIAALVAQTPGLRLSDLFQQGPAISRDTIYTLIAHQQIYVDLRSVPLAEPDRVSVFPTAALAQALAAPVSTDQLHDTSQCAHPASLAGRSDAPAAVGSAAGDLLAQASPAALAEANRRYASIAPLLHGAASPANAPPARTLRLWVAAFRHAEQQYGSGYVGLLPRWNQRGNRTPRLPADTQQLLNDTITTYYEADQQPRKAAVYGRLVQACEAHGVPVPSYRTFATAIRQRSRYRQTLQRRGPRAAYPDQPWFWELALTTPRHGDRPFEIGHLDHTELDIELVCSRTGRLLGRPWATFLVDAFSRTLLAITLTFDPPSYRSCLAGLRRCVQRHQRLPAILVVDGGKEFASTYLETLLARYEVMKKTRPAAKPRFGSVIERLFGTTNTQFIYNLVGNTQITHTPRQVSPRVDPKRQARWTLDRLSAYLERWADDVYATTVHPALGQSPRDALATGLLQSGLRPHRQIAYDDVFRLATLPTTAKGTAKVQPNLGVKIATIYYWSEAFRDPAVEQTQVRVRYDPFDAGTAYAFVQGRWVHCISEQYARFVGHSERELQLAAEELRRRNQQHAQRFSLTARQLADFLVSVEAEEVLLEQRLRDLAQRDLVATSGGAATALHGSCSAPAQPSTARSARTPAELAATPPQIAVPLTTYEDY